jgi:hypothetical protein
MFLRMLVSQRKFPVGSFLGGLSIGLKKTTVFFFLSTFIFLKLPFLHLHLFVFALRIYILCKFRQTPISLSTKLKTNKDQIFLILKKCLFCYLFQELRHSYGSLVGHTDSTDGSEKHVSWMRYYFKSLESIRLVFRLTYLLLQIEKSDKTPYIVHYVW